MNAVHAHSLPRAVISTAQHPLQLTSTRSQLVHDQLFTLAEGRTVPRLAVSAESAPDLSAVTVRLREGVRFHDGAPLRAADVAWSLGYLTAPERPYPSELSSFFDVPALRVLDDRTLWIPTRAPVGDPAGQSTWTLSEGVRPTRALHAATSGARPEAEARFRS